MCPLARVRVPGGPFVKGTDSSLLEKIQGWRFILFGKFEVLRNLNFP